MKKKQIKKSEKNKGESVNNFSEGSKNLKKEGKQQKGRYTGKDNKAGQKERHRETQRQTSIHTTTQHKENG